MFQLNYAESKFKLCFCVNGKKQKLNVVFFHSQHVNRIQRGGGYFRFLFLSGCHMAFFTPSPSSILKMSHIKQHQSLPRFSKE